MMKLCITFKDPDGVSDSLEDAGLDQNDLPEDVRKIMDKYIAYDEYLTVEFDLATGTAEVLPK